MGPESFPPPKPLPTNVAEQSFQHRGSGVSRGLRAPVARLLPRGPNNVQHF